VSQTVVLVVKASGQETTVKSESTPEHSVVRRNLTKASMRSDVKRRRNLSSPGSLSRSEAGTSDEEGQDATSSKGTKKTPRGAAARSQKEKEQREQREKERVEAASKRKGRADRRRAEGRFPHICVWQQTMPPTDSLTSGRCRIRATRRIGNQNFFK
jgi:hypothetical protein